MRVPSSVQPTRTSLLGHPVILTRPKLRFAASRSRQFVHGNAHLPDQLAQLSPLGWRLRGFRTRLASCRYARLGVLKRCDRHGCDIVHLAPRFDAEALGRALERAFTCKAV